MGQRRVHIPCLRGSEPGPEAQLIGVGRQLGGLEEQRSRLVVAGGGRALVAEPRQPVRLLERDQSRQLPERVRVVLHAQRDHRLPRLTGGRYDQKRGRLTPAQIAAGGLGGIECGQQPVSEGALRRRERREHRRPYRR